MTNAVRGESPDVSIVIASWNTRDILRDCLVSIGRHAGELAIEVIVVDNASQDGSPDMVRREFPSVRLIANDLNRGFAGANNQGIEVAAGRYVLLLNSDALLLEGSLPEAVRFADANPQAGVIGCRLLNADRSLQPSCFEYPSLSNLALVLSRLPVLFPHSRFLAKERMTWWPHDTARPVDCVVGAFMLARREAIEKVGGLDPAFFMYAEEADWCRRMNQANWPVLFTPSASVVHLGGASSAPVEGAMFRQLQGSTLLFMRKHYSRLYYWLGCLLIWLFLASRSTAWFAAGLLRSGSRTRAWARARDSGLGLWQLTSRGPRGLCVEPPRV